jgi:hypothetical protein
VIQRGKRSILETPVPSTRCASSLAEAVQAFLLERRIAGGRGTTVATYRGQLDELRIKTT